MMLVSTVTILRHLSIEIRRKIYYNSNRKAKMIAKKKAKLLNEKRYNYESVSPNFIKHGKAFSVDIFSPGILNYEFFKSNN